MRKNNNTFIPIYSLLALASMLLSACMKDENQAELSSECYIKTFALDAVMQAHHTKAQDGTDSLYYTKIDGSYFPMRIDQRNLIIQNTDSLPYGVNIKTVLAKVDYIGKDLAYRYTQPNDTDFEWTPFNATDSIDYTRGVEFLVNSEDYINERIYSIRLVVHQQEGDSLYWHQSDIYVPQLEDLDSTHAIAFNDQLLVWGKTENSIAVAVRETLAMASNWTRHQVSLPIDANLSTIQYQHSHLYLSTQSGQLFKSKDGITWTALGATHQGLILVGASNQYLYALVDGQIHHSEDGENWTPDELDENPSLLPLTHIQSAFYHTDNSHRLFLGGTDQVETYTWTKSWHTDRVEADAMWMSLNSSQNNPYTYPMLNQQVVLPYDNSLFTFGGSRIDKEGTSMGTLYVSYDNGINWKRHLTLHLPAELVGFEGEIAAAVDNHSYIWIITNQQVWRGRLNRLGFDKP